MALVRGPRSISLSGVSRTLRFYFRFYLRRRTLSMVLLAVGAGLLLYVGSQYWSMYRSQQQLEAEWDRQAASGGGLGQPAGLPGALLTRVLIPKINLDAVVVEGTSRKQLLAGPGHLQDTAMPGTSGNSVITAHRDTFFRHIFELDKGDEIVIHRGGQIFRYQVTGKKVVTPEDVSVLKPTDDAQLTLITCYPTYYIGPAPERLVVFSKLAP
jgi:LPXTG-site transpeptidase (sortase) family protein